MLRDGWCVETAGQGRAGQVIGRCHHITWDEGRELTSSNPTSRAARLARGK